MTQSEQSDGPGGVTQGTVTVSAASIHELLEAGQAMAAALATDEVYIPGPMIERWACALGLMRGVVGYRS